MKIQVTQEDIRKGIRNASRGCPVAIAISRIIKLRYVSVSDCWITLGGKSFRTPFAVRVFMRNFDKGIEVEPFEFKLFEFEL